ncbi:dynamin family protein [Brachybacterium sp. NBEC-018]|uniref:dynamin family protein n=1 Tax=Brachybacterium sp. NBEC-018 TaxID=2996004 RepID=UPI002175161F|nr:dynamin family protein [Brachybacterium sp. NBEC-018]UVY85410.1 dynamin family protein [Brachybacterium sp. NBEC-018]
MTTTPAAVLGTFAEHLRTLELPLPVEGAEDARREVAAALTQLDDHVIPRVESLDAPLLVVVGGSTGAGKSTLVNSVVGEAVSRSGAIRPTTRRPVLLHHPADEPWFTGTRILPGLARVTGSGGGTTAEAEDASVAATSLELRSLPAIPQGLALLDAPDIDSVAAGNRELARQLLRAADLWLFVTTANRYADAVPWEVLRTAAERDVTVDVVMNRVPEAPGVAEELSGDLRTMLERQGIDPDHLLLVPETRLDAEGMVPAEVIAPLRERLVSLAEDAETRGRIARRTLAGAVGGLAVSAREIAAHAAAQHEEAERLEGEVDAAFATSRERIDEAVGDGSLLRGEVLSRWQDVVGTGEFLRGVESLVGRLRDRIGMALTGRTAPAVKAEQALGASLVHVLIDETARGAERADTAWRRSPAGRSLAEGHDLSRLPDGFGEEAAASIRAWQGDVLDLVRTEGADRRTKARVLSLGVNVLGVALMVIVFVSTAFIPTGLEVGVGAGAAVVGQKLLESIFGDEAVRRMATVARERLTARLDALVNSRTAPFRERLDTLGDLRGGELLGGDADALEELAASIREQS